MLISLHNLAVLWHVAEKSSFFMDLSAYFGDFLLLCKLNGVINPRKACFIMSGSLHNNKSGG